MTESDPSPPTVWSRLARALVNVLRILLFVAIVAAIAAGAWLGYRELVRSLNVIADRADLNAQRIELMRRDVDGLITDTRNEESIRDIQNALATQEAQLADLRSRLDDDLVSQQAALQELQVQVTTLISQTGVITTDVAALQEGITALQSDVNTGRSDLDALGGDLDALNLSMESLEEQFREVSEDAGQLATMQQALTLFRVWELLARARIYLIDGNAGLAIADLEAATAIVDHFVETIDPEEDARLLGLQTRLALTRESLPTAPASAARDLETAWELLDSMIAERLDGAGSLGTTPTEAPAPTVTPTTTTTPAVTPTATQEP